MYKKQNETKIQKQIQEYLRGVGAYCFKVHGDMFTRAGIPDIICCYKGKFIGIECKDGNNKASSLQLAHGIQIQKSGGLFCIAKSVSDISKFLSEHF